LSSGLRTVSKLIAVGLWTDYGFSTYDKTICSTCRVKLEKKYVNQEMHEKTQRVLEWLYDATILYTPQSTPTTNDISYNVGSEILSEKKQSFSRWMKDHFFDGRIERTTSYHRLHGRSKMKYVLKKFD